MQKLKLALPLLALLSTIAGCISGPRSAPLVVNSPPHGRVVFLPVNEVDLCGTQNSIDFLKDGANAAINHICKGAPFLVPADQLVTDLRRAGLQELLKAYVSNADASSDLDLFDHMSRAAASQGYDTILRLTIRADAKQESGGNGGFGMFTKGKIDVAVSEYHAGKTTPRRTANGTGTVDYMWMFFLFIPAAAGEGTSFGVDQALHAALSRLYEIQ